MSKAEETTTTTATAPATPISLPELKKQLDFTVEQKFEWIDIDALMTEAVKSLDNNALAARARELAQGRRRRFVTDIREYSVRKYVNKETTRIYAELYNKCPDVRCTEVDVDGSEAIPRNYMTPANSANKQFVQFIAQCSNRFLDEKNVFARIEKKLGTKLSRTHTAYDAGYAFQFLQAEKIPPQKIKTAFEEENWLASDFKFGDAQRTYANLKGRRYQVCLRNVKYGENTVEKCIETFQNEGYINYYGLTADQLAVYEYYFHIAKALCLSRPREALFKYANTTCYGERSKFELIRAAQQLVGTKVSVLKPFLENSDISISDELHLIWLIAKVRCEESDTAKGRATKYSFNANAVLEKCRPEDLCYFIDLFMNLIWNRALSIIISKREGLKLEVGDLVFVDADAEKRIADDPFGAAVPKDKKGESIKELVRPVTEEDIVNQRFTVFDMVLPVPGNDVLLPNNDTKRMLLDTVTKVLQQKTLGSLQKLGPIVFRGTYRKVCLKPENLKWKLKFYMNDNTSLILDDLPQKAQQQEKRNLDKKIKVSDRSVFYDAEHPEFLTPPAADANTTATEEKMETEEATETKPEAKEDKAKSATDKKLLRREQFKLKRAKANAKRLAAQGAQVEKIPFRVKSAEEDEPAKEPKDGWKDINDINRQRRPDNNKVALILDFFVPKGTSYLIALRELMQRKDIFNETINEPFDPEKVRYEDLCKFRTYVEDLVKVLPKEAEVKPEKDTKKAKKTPAGKTETKSSYVKANGEPNILAIRRLMRQAKQLTGREKIKVQRELQKIRRQLGDDVMAAAAADPRAQQRGPTGQMRNQRGPMGRYGSQGGPGPQGRFGPPGRFPMQGRFPNQDRFQRQPRFQQRDGGFGGPSNRFPQRQNYREENPKDKVVQAYQQLLDALKSDQNLQLLSNIEKLQNTITGNLVGDAGGYHGQQKRFRSNEGRRSFNGPRDQLNRSVRSNPSEPRRKVPVRNAGPKQQQQGGKAPQKAAPAQAAKTQVAKAAPAKPAAKAQPGKQPVAAKTTPQAAVKPQPQAAKPVQQPKKPQPQAQRPAGQQQAKGPQQANRPQAQRAQPGAAANKPQPQRQAPVQQTRPNVGNGPNAGNRQNNAPQGGGNRQINANRGGFGGPQSNSNQQSSGPRQSFRNEQPVRDVPPLFNRRVGGGDNFTDRGNTQSFNKSSPWDSDNNQRSFDSGFNTQQRGGFDDGLSRRDDFQGGGNSRGFDRGFSSGNAGGNFRDNNDFDRRPQQQQSFAARDVQSFDRGDSQNFSRNTFDDFDRRPLQQSTISRDNFDGAAFDRRSNLQQSFNDRPVQQQQQQFNRPSQSLDFDRGSLPFERSSQNFSQDLDRGFSRGGDRGQSFNDGGDSFNSNNGPQRSFERNQSALGFSISKDTFIRQPDTFNRNGGSLGGGSNAFGGNRVNDRQAFGNDQGGRGFSSSGTNSSGFNSNFARDSNSNQGFRGNDDGRQGGGFNANKGGFGGGRPQPAGYNSSNRGGNNLPFQRR